ncbi:hypothetical protein TWF730_010099 [Orbilia blumenaviensis]|uniref:Uncharacterized protein n=1 Tax=Orbilia blumenaviensis TaxID=1796055 RepID=A0AAV9UTP9_9PEZI
MHFSTLLTSITVALVGIIDVTSAHCVFIDAYGNAKPAIRGHGLGFGPFTPRKGTHLLPHQRDIAVFDDRVVHTAWNKKYRPYGCGCSAQTSAVWYEKNMKTRWKEKGSWLFNDVTPAAAFINVKSSVDYLAFQETRGVTRSCLATGRKGLKTGIPQVTAGGKLHILVYQVNLDGGGPFKCKIDYKGNGATWTAPLQVIKNCPGDQSSSFNWPGIGKTCWVSIAMPKRLNCHGKYGANGRIENVCLVRCENNAANGPFGGCVPIKQFIPSRKVVTKKVGTKKVVSTKVITKKKYITKQKTVRVPVTKFIRVPAPKPTKVAPPRIRVVTVTRATVIVLTQGKVRKTTSVAKGGVVTITETVKLPPAKTSTVTVFEEEIFDEEVPEDGKDDDDEDEDDSSEVEADPANDDANKVGPKAAEATEKPTPEEIEAAIGGEEFDEDDIEKLKDEKVSKEDKELLQEAAKSKDQKVEFEDIPDSYKL